ncbi:unnamed protein product [Ilex paraguariensis]|uniref:Uncharacterized protein n=1 Tax=Ilex paraguariensis TaxID=185542 RepID=A0ABC8TMW9_9AQUA
MQIHIIRLVLAAIFYIRIFGELPFKWMLLFVTKQYLYGHKNWVLCIAWSADDKHLISGSKAGDLQYWDPLTGKPSRNPLICDSSWLVKGLMALAESVSSSGYENNAYPSSFLSVTWNFYVDFATPENENKVSAAISVMF